jgi:DNA-binding NarL/FixJ family response regulator
MQVDARSHQCRARHTLGHIALCEGNPRETVRHLEIVRQLMSHNGRFNSSHLWWVGDLIEAHIVLGQVTEAAELINALHAEAQRTGHRYPRAAAARGEALLATGDAAADKFHEAIGVFDDLGAPFESARTSLLFAERLAASHEAAADAARTRALATFERLGARAWAARAAGATAPRGRGEPRDVASLPEFEKLTPRELEVALLAARGRKNQEIADELFIASKTVAHQLGSIYRKLAVRSRTELANMMLDHA